MIVTYVCIDSTACIKLEEYQTAKVALEAGLKLAPGDMRFTKLIKECDERIAGMWAITLSSTKGEEYRAKERSFFAVHAKRLKTM